MSTSQSVSLSSETGAEQSIHEAQQVLTKNPRVLQTQESVLTKRAMAIPVSDSELAEIEGAVKDKIKQLREIDVYTDSEQISSSFNDLFSFSQSRKTQARELMSDFSRRNYKGLEDSESFKVVGELREALEKYDPKKFSLSSPERILGFIPLPGGIKKRVRNYANSLKTGETHINEIMGGVTGIIEDSLRAKEELKSTDKKLLLLVKELRKQHIVLERLDDALSEYLDELKERDPIKMEKIKSDVMFKLKQERLDTVTILNTSLLGVDQIRILQETQDMIETSCRRLQDSGNLILSVNQVLVFATHGQQQAANFLESANASINSLTESTAHQIKDHAKKMADFSENPLAAVESLDKAFSDTFAAMDTLSQHAKQRTERVQSSITAMNKRLETMDGRRLSEKQSFQAFGEVVAQVGTEIDSRGVSLTNDGSDLSQVDIKSKVTATRMEASRTGPTLGGPR